MKYKLDKIPVIFFVKIKNLANQSYTTYENYPNRRREYLFTIKYNLDIEGKLAIINSFQDENLAKEMVKNLTTKGFKCDYFFLPNKSNSTEKVYKVFIGPYESLEEVNQWKQNVNGEVEILNL